MTAKRHRGGGGARHPNSLANLKRGQNPAPKGNTLPVTHGGHSDRLMAPGPEDVIEIMDLMSDRAPIKDEKTGRAPDTDIVAIEIAARCLKRWRAVVQWNDSHGRVSGKGDAATATGAARFELDAERALTTALDNIGLSPLARSRLGLNVAKAEEAWSISGINRQAAEILAQEEREEWQRRAVEARTQTSAVHATAIENNDPKEQ